MRATEFPPSPPILLSNFSLLYRYISEVGGVVQPGTRFVSCRACMRAYVRARGVLGQVRIQPKRGLWTFPFPFDLAGLSLFLCETIYSLFPRDQDFPVIFRILVISLISMIPSESK